MLKGRMVIVARCPNCGKRARLADGQAESLNLCAACGTQFTLPVDEPAMLETADGLVHDEPIRDEPVRDEAEIPLTVPLEEQGPSLEESPATVPLVVAAEVPTIQPVRCGYGLWSARELYWAD